MATFEPGVERWRSQMAKYADGVPIDFLLAWIKRESSGRPGLVSSLGERGLFQVHPGGERDMLKLSQKEWDDLLNKSNATTQIKSGVKLAKLYSGYAKRFLKDVGQEWNGQDFYKMVKLHHAAFAVPKYTLLGFKNTFGRGPNDWNEFEQFAFKAADEGTDLVPKDKKLSARIRSLTRARNIWENADEVGGVVPPAPPGQIIAGIFDQIVKLFSAA